MKRHRVGDGGEDAGGSAGAQPLRQKPVKVSAIPKGKVRNDELKNRHSNEVHPC